MTFPPPLVVPHYSAPHPITVIKSKLCNNSRYTSVWGVIWGEIQESRWVNCHLYCMSTPTDYCCGISDSDFAWAMWKILSYIFDSNLTISSVKCQTIIQVWHKWRWNKTVSLARCIFPLLKHGLWWLIWTECRVLIQHKCSANAFWDFPEEFLILVGVTFTTSGPNPAP